MKEKSAHYWRFYGNISEVVVSLLVHDCCPGTNYDAR